jgi:hypothetical protein
MGWIHAKLQSLRQTHSAPMPDGFINQWEATIPVASAELRVSGICLVVLRDGLIARNGVFFDRARLMDVIRAQGGGSRGSVRAS